MPLVSIIIPHFNRAKLLTETVDSVRRQSHENWELFVVDDGSDEREWPEIQALADERIRIIQRTDGQKGPSRCRNLGVAHSRGDYLVFVDSDDLLAPWCLSERLHHAEEFPGNDLWVFPVMLFEQSPGDVPVCWNRLEGDRDLERFLRTDPPWHTSSPLWRRDAFNRVGGFNEAVMYGDDADLHVRTLLTGVKYVKFPHLQPDLFVRRSATARITNSMNPAILQSRLTRLTEGSNALRIAGANGEIQQIWEGQYFVEGEFLLFNAEQPGLWIDKVIKAWRAECQPSWFRKMLVKVYFGIAQLTRDRFYLVLRLARRLVMLVAPHEYFPKGGHFHAQEIDKVDYAELRRRLRDQVPGWGK